ncbi:ThuA domain-containing protein [Paenibacillus sp. Z6-24]
MINVTVWNEFVHEQIRDDVKAVYPDGIHKVLADGLTKEGFACRTATLDQDEHGLTESVLNSTDVMLWWGHTAHDLVDDEIAEAVVRRVQEGMGLIVLHSGHFSKPFKQLMGTSCDLKWRVADEQEILWCVNPNHPISQGVNPSITLDKEEMYGEFFDVPAPDELVYLSNFEGGEVFRSGCTYRRGHGKIFYFRPGHETYPTYYNQDIMHIIANAVRWAQPAENARPAFGRTEPTRAIGGKVLV